jgi:hypothetical protein
MPMQLQTSRIHIDDSAVEFCPVQGFYCLFCRGIIRHLDKRKAPRLACPLVSHNPKPFHSSMFLKYGSNVLLSGVRTQVSHKNVIHLCFARGSGLAYAPSFSGKNHAGRTVRWPENS